MDKGTVLCPMLDGNCIVPSFVAFAKTDSIVLAVCKLAARKAFFVLHELPPRVAIYTKIDSDRKQKKISLLIQHITMHFGINFG